MVGTDTPAAWLDREKRHLERLCRGKREDVTAMSHALNFLLTAKVFYGFVPSSLITGGCDTGIANRKLPPTEIMQSL